MFKTLTQLKLEGKHFMLYTETLIARPVEITEAKQASNEYRESVIVIQRWALVSTDLNCW